MRVRYLAPIVLLAALGGAASTQGAIITSGNVSPVHDGTDPWEISGDLRVGDSGSGALSIDDGSGVSNIVGRIGFGFGSTGTVTVAGEGSVWNNTGGLLVGENGAGTLTISDGGHVNNTFGNLAFNPGAAGTVIVTGAGSTWVNSDSLVVGDLSMGELTITDGGSVISTDGIIGLSGSFGGATGTVTVGGADASWTMSGRLSVGGDAVFGGGNGGTGTLGIHSGSRVEVAQDTVLFPDGMVRFQGGTLTTTGISFEGGGQFQWTGGTLHVDTFHGDLMNQGGALAPGRPGPGESQVAGGTTIIGSYTQQSSATLAMEIGGTATATQHDFVNVTGTALLGGALELALIGNFVPDPADQFIIFNASSLLGFFSNAGSGQRLMTEDGFGSFLVQYGPTSPLNPNQLVLSAFQIEAIPGDANLDGRVDGEDFLIWQASFGMQSGATWDDGDFNGDGRVDGEDFLIWQANFGSVAPSAAATPESGAIVPLFTLLLAFARRRRA